MGIESQRPTVLPLRPCPDGVLVSEPAPVLLSWRWLRDHGEDEASQDPETLQRRVDTFSLDPLAKGEATVADDSVVVTWEDGARTTVSVTTIKEVIAEHRSVDWNLVAGYGLKSVPTLETPIEEIAADAFLADDATAAAGLAQLLDHGYLVLRGDRADRALVEMMADRVGYVRHTVFGGVWDLAADLSAHADTAYTEDFLGPHTDGTYSNDAPGLQLFHCLQPADEGGESIVVDAFAIAAELLASEPEVAATLATVVVPGRYLEPGVHLRAERPVLRADHRGRLVQVSFNNYDRAPFLLPPGLEDRFYYAYGRFAELANQQDRRRLIGLTPGDFLLVDNWRSLHGRNAFRGPRHYVGAYLNREDAESTRRVLAAS